MNSQGGDDDNAYQNRPQTSDKMAMGVRGQKANL